MKKYLLISCIIIVNVFTQINADTNNTVNGIEDVGVDLINGDKDVKTQHQNLIFPKTAWKFVVTPHTHTSRTPFYRARAKINKLIISTTSKRTNYNSKTVTRRPLMKMKTFTVPTLSNRKFNNLSSIIHSPSIPALNNLLVKETQQNTARHQPIKAVSEGRVEATNSTDKPTNLDKNALHKTTTKETKPNTVNAQLAEENKIAARSDLTKTKDKQNNLKESELRVSVKVLSKANSFRKLKRSRRGAKKFSDVVSETIDINKYIDQELQDRKEFMFMGTIKGKEIEHNTFDNDKDDSRVKRSNNIIEEENFITTVSTLQYTGRDTKLTNNLYFNNINS